MTVDEKLAAILAAVQTDPGNRGLARVPGDNLFTATASDFQKACWSIAGADSVPEIETGFFIPNGDPPAFETDGPLGAMFLLRTIGTLFHQVNITVHQSCGRSLLSAAEAAEVQIEVLGMNSGSGGQQLLIEAGSWPRVDSTHSIALELVGRAKDGGYYSMRGRDIREHTLRIDGWYELPLYQRGAITIGIGDGGNEIGMGKIPHETIVANIPNGDLIHCVVPTDHLIVAGVSNWGAYALAAGVFVLRGVTPPKDLFDPETELRILEVMVKEGPLVDGVTGLQTATVDGLTWDEYAKPLIAIRDILNS